MSPALPVDVTVYPDDCDAFGHVNQAAFFRMFERVRWDAVARGPGMEIFTQRDAWPALRKTTVEYYVSAFPGDRLRYEAALTHQGRTSFTLRQTAWRSADERLVAEGEFVFVCVDRAGRPIAVPPEIGQVFGDRSSDSAASRPVARARGTTVDDVGTGPAIVFVHGFPLDRTVWRPLIARLPGWRCVGPNLRSVGGEIEEGSVHSMPRYAADLLALLDHLELDDAVFCGLSMGGYVLFELLRHHPRRVRALILCNTRAEADPPQGRAARDAMAALVRRDGPSALADQMIPRLLAADTLQSRPALVEQVRSMIMGTTPDGIVGALTAMKERADAVSLLSSIAIPTLVIGGADDVLIPRDQVEQLAREIPGARLAIIPQAGHLAPLEQPAATAQVIREFLAAQP